MTSIDGLAADPPNPELQAMQQQVDALDERTRRTQWDVWFQIAARGLAVAAPVLAGIAWARFDDMGKTSIDTQQRVRLLEATQFSAQDGASLRAEMLETFASRFPPAWLTESIQRIEHATGKVAERMSSLEARLSALEGKLQTGRDK